MYPLIRNLHTVLAALSIAGFVLRGAWMLRGSPLLRQRLVRTVPHVVDTLFLASGITLLLLLDLPVLQSAWLLAKFAGLFAYIGLGLVALRFGPTPQLRLVAFAGAVAAFAYIVGVALSKSPLSWMVQLAG
jgi:uncharacterized membrane protein SirB2